VVETNTLRLKSGHPVRGFAIGVVRNLALLVGTQTIGNIALRIVSMPAIPNVLKSFINAILRKLRYTIKREERFMDATPFLCVFINDTLAYRQPAKHVESIE